MSGPRSLALLFLGAIGRLSFVGLAALGEHRADGLGRLRRQGMVAPMQRGSRSRPRQIGDDVARDGLRRETRWRLRLAPGTRVGPYEVLAVLGAGGMGEVYRARDTRLGREVALKVISDGTPLDAERLQRFEQEARLAGSLNHPNLVVVHDVGSEGDAPFLVTELLEGESLRHRLSRGCRYGPRWSSR